MVRVRKEERLEARYQDYQSSDIYNPAEPSLFRMMLPETSRRYSGQMHHGKTKQVKTWLTVGTNQNGTNRLSLPVSGKTTKAVAFRNINIPVTYLENKTYVDVVNYLRRGAEKMDRWMKMTNRSEHREQPGSLLAAKCNKHIDSRIIQNRNIHYRFIPQYNNRSAVQFTSDILGTVMTLEIRRQIR